MNSLGKIYWVEELGITLLLYFSAKRIFGKLQVRYDEHVVSKAFNKMIAVSNTLFREDIFVPAYLVLNQKDAEGYALDYQRQQTLMAAIDHFSGSYLDKENDSFRNMVRCILSNSFNPRVTFITMVNKNISTMSGYKHEIYIKSHYTNYILIKYLRSAGISVRQCSPFAGYFFESVSIIVFLMRTGLFNLVSKNTAKIAAAPSLWIEYTPAHAVWDGFRRYLSSVISDKKYKISYYFDRTDTPFDTNTVKKLEDEGFNCIEIFETKHMVLYPQDVLNSIKDVSRFGLFGKPLWLIMFKFNERIRFQSFKNLYKKYNVCALIQHRETSWLQEVQAQALEAEGGIMIGLHWSNYLSYKYPTHLTPQQVFFVWGEAHSDLLYNKGNTCRHILPSGIWIRENNDEMTLKEKFAENIDFKMAVFDDSADYNIYCSRDSFSEYYLRVINLLERHPSWGMIVKSKQWGLKDFINFPNGKQICDRLESLILQKRVIILDHVRYSPVFAAKKADLSICLGINSAGIISGLYGSKTIHWDCVGWKDYPLYRDPSQKVIYQSFDDIEKAAEQCYKGDNSIGDLSAYKKQYNYFGDTTGIERIDHFIDSYFEARNDTAVPQDALKSAVDAYKNHNSLTDDLSRNHGWWN